MPAALPFTLELLALTAVVCGAHATRERLGRAPLFVLLGTRVGIHSGTAVAGNIGTGARIKYAVVGDAVNTAARIEALVKTLGERLLFSSDTLALLGDTVAARPCGSHAVKGRAQPVTVFTTTSPPTTTTSTTSTTATAATTTATTATTAHAAEPLDIVPR